MEQLLLSDRRFSISGIGLYMTYANRRCSFAGEDIWNAFEEKSGNSSDFSFYIHAEEPPREFWEQEEAVRFTDTQIIMNYSGRKEYLVLVADRATDCIHLYNNADVYNNEWFGKLGNLFSWLVLEKDSCYMHGVILEIQGKGIVLTASSGTGKSTHAHYWRDQENAWIINGDRALLRRIGNQWWACGSPWRGTSGECINRKVPLSAIVVLDRGEQNHARRLNSMEAFSRLVPRMIAPRQDQKLGELCIDYTCEIAAKIPVFELHCINHSSSVDCLKELLMMSGILADPHD